MEGYLTGNICEIEVKKAEAKRIEINIERVVILTLIFTNAFFISYFFAKLFKLI